MADTETALYLGLGGNGERQMLALSRANRHEVHPEVEAILELPYELLGRMEADAQDERIRWIDREFSERVTLRVAVRKASAEFWAQRWEQCYPLRWEWARDQ